MRIIDISREISGDTVVYPGDDPVVLERPWRIGPDGPVNMSRLACTTHTATHLDAPIHMLENGQPLDALPLERFVGPARVIAIDGDVIGPDDIPPRELTEGRCLLFKTRHSADRTSVAFDKQHVFMTPEAARLAARRGANLVGIDTLSVDPFGSEDFPAHRALLEEGVLILEGLDLHEAAPGDTTLLALPLKIKEADGAPVRAVLIEGLHCQ